MNYKTVMIIGRLGQRLKHILNPHQKTSIEVGCNKKNLTILIKLKFSNTFETSKRNGQPPKRQLAKKPT
jgi:hypothetical protein